MLTCRGSTLCLSTILLCLLTAPASWGQTYNPTASDPVTGNTAGGLEALSSHSGFENTAFGRAALASNPTGSYNTALGSAALAANTGGHSNTASGYAALYSNTTGSSNTASGSAALAATTTGFSNTATGRFALRSNTTAHANTATGDLALYANTTGSHNTASGSIALWHNTTGSRNVASGREALSANTTGFANTADGSTALRDNTIGIRNTALGSNALLTNTTGSRNTAVGWGSGAALRSGNDNLYLGHPGVATESNTLRLGAVQTRVFIAGVAGRPIANGSHVMINSAGQLGVLASSARYKQDIQPMGEQSQKLQQLRPVTFHYKEEPTGPIQYGLIAEEVAKVYPELVIRNPDGTIEGVQYEELTPLLLNQVQQQQTELAELRARLDRIEAGIQTTKR
jgi:trimeric autotransporter adhesin